MTLNRKGLYLQIQFRAPERYTKDIRTKGPTGEFTDVYAR
jgi:hypothetical protein